MPLVGRREEKKETIQQNGASGHNAASGKKRTNRSTVGGGVCMRIQDQIEENKVFKMLLVGKNVRTGRL